MSVKAVIGGVITSLITSPRLRNGRRGLEGLKLKLRGAPAQVHYFHQTDDPYSHLMLQVLPTLLANYQIELVLHAASIPTSAPTNCVNSSGRLPTGMPKNSGTVTCARLLTDTRTPVASP